MTTTNESIPDWLLEKTFCAEYSPNCPMKWLVRLCGKGVGVIDKLPPRKSKDAIGVGFSIAGAAHEARKDYSRQGEAS